MFTEVFANTTVAARRSFARRAVREQHAAWWLSQLCRLVKRNMKIALFCAALCVILACSDTRSLAPDKEPVYKNLGRDECKNIRGHMETCGYLQFCSQYLLEKGCRNCTDIADEWCKVDPEGFRQQYPTCEILCESKRTLALEHDKDRLSDENTILKTIVLFVVGTLVFGLCVLVVTLPALCRAQNQHVNSRGTATHQRGCQWCTFLSGPKLSVPVAAQPSGQEAPEEAVPLTDIATTTGHQPSDSGNGSNHTLQNLTAPSGGTEHHPQDVHDFMRSQGSGRNADIHAADDLAMA